MCHPRTSRTNTHTPRFHRREGVSISLTGHGRGRSHTSRSTCCCGTRRTRRTRRTRPSGTRASLGAPGGVVESICVRKRDRERAGRHAEMIYTDEAYSHCTRSARGGSHATRVTGSVTGTCIHACGGREVWARTPATVYSFRDRSPVARHSISPSCTLGPY